ncbi:MAG TPA: membrane protein insertion efficiency factor YidD [Halanaerobiales bacterium]|nr:membrane protein insertion efficiency factor YidD [Halanaerobiales bacterium]
MKKIIIVLIFFYQRVISPWKPQSCRFKPSCSEYAKKAIIKYGAFKGGWMSIRRVLRCHPFNSGGYDPVK